MKSVRDADVHKKIVFLRCDFNVPLKNGNIVDDHRIREALPTIQYLLEKKAKIIIATHVGRPKMPQYEAELSTVIVAKRLSELLHHEIIATDYVTGTEVDRRIEEMKPGGILVLGNLRFNSGEELNDDIFAKKLANMADVYVNDAFAVSHRENASDEAITKFLPSYSGLLFESEIATLSFLLDNPESPFILVIGGVKFEDKAGFLNHLSERVDKILVGGAIANTFLKAKGEDIGQSLYDREMIPVCEKILLQFGEKIILPVDSIKEDLGNGEFKIMDIGPKTVETFVHEINNSASIFWNGNLGYTEDSRYAVGTRAVADAMSASHGSTVVAGGDTASFINRNGLKGGPSFVSTGGASSMEFLSGSKLPGIEALNRAEL